MFTYFFVCFDSLYVSYFVIYFVLCTYLHCHRTSVTAAVELMVGLVEETMRSVVSSVFLLCVLYYTGEKMVRHILEVKKASILLKREAWKIQVIKECHCRVVTK